MTRYGVAVVLALAGCSSAARPQKAVVAKPRRVPNDASSPAGDTGPSFLDAGRADAAARARASAAAREADAMATPLCSGDDRMQLAAADFSNASYGPSDGLAMRNGIRALFIDGRCNYYAIRPAQHGAESVELAEVHSGALDDATRDALSNELRYSEWAILQVGADQASGSTDASFLFDAGSTTLTDGVRVLDCYAGCNAIQGTPIASEVLAVLAAADKWIDDLYDRGTPMTGDVRIIVSRRPDTLGPITDGHPAQWPLSRPITDFESRLGPPNGGSFIWFTLGGADAAALRYLRTQQVTGTFTPWWKGDGSVLPVSETPDGPVYDLTVSDRLPYEDEEGPGIHARLHIWNQVFPSQT